MTCSSGDPLVKMEIRSAKAIHKIGLHLRSHGVNSATDLMSYNGMNVLYRFICRPPSPLELGRILTQVYLTHGANICESCVMTIRLPGPQEHHIYSIIGRRGSQLKKFARRYDLVYSMVHRNEIIDSNGMYTATILVVSRTPDKALQAIRAYNARVVKLEYESMQRYAKTVSLGDVSQPTWLDVISDIVKTTVPVDVTYQMPVRKPLSELQSEILNQTPDSLIKAHDSSKNTQQSKNVLKTRTESNGNRDTEDSVKSKKTLSAKTNLVQLENKL